MFKKKIITIFLSILMITGSLVFSQTAVKVSAATVGWTQSGGVWYYLNSNGTKATGWIQSGGSWYYLNSNGSMATGWIQNGGSWYYLNSNGSMATGWIQSGGSWYYLNSNGAMATGWIQSGGKWYYLNSNGAMATGWIKSGSKWYYLYSSGAMATNWIQDGGKWYYLNPNGDMVTGWNQIGSKTYYFYSGGGMAFNTTINGIYIGSDGAVQDNKSPSVSLNKTTNVLTVGGTDTLIATVSPASASNQALNWTSSNTAIATVDSTGKVTAVSAGVARIVVAAADGSYNASCTVTVTNKAPIKIAIDPGHGGYDSGAVGSTGVLEKKVTLAISLKVGQILQQNGIDVVYTRTSDNVSWPSNVTSDLQTRCDIANNANVNYFICIHANSFSDPAAKGTETYYLSGSSAGQKLAQSIQQELVKVNGLQDRGIKTANYYVLKNTNAPAILTEVAFISNPNEESLLNSNDFQQKCAQAIVNGILKAIN